MVRQLVTHIWCDVCFREDEAYVEAQETPPITIGQAKPRRLALCERHTKLYNEFHDLVLDVGQAVEVEETQAPTPKRQKRNPNPSPLQPPYICKVPGCATTERGHEFPNRQSLATHIRTQHGHSVGEYAQQYLDQPAPELPFDDLPDEDWKCGVEDCDKAYPPESYKDHRRLIRLHRSREHGIRGQSR